MKQENLEKIVNSIIKSYRKSKVILSFNSTAINNLKKLKEKKDLDFFKILKVLFDDNKSIGNKESGTYRVYVDAIAAYITEKLELNSENKDLAEALAKDLIDKTKKIDDEKNEKNLNHRELINNMCESKYILRYIDKAKMENTNYLQRILKNNLHNYLYQFRDKIHNYGKMSEYDFIEAYEYCYTNNCLKYIDQIENASAADKNLFKIDPLVYVKAKKNINSKVFDYIIDKEVKYYNAPYVNRDDSKVYLNNFLLVDKDDNFKYLDKLFNFIKKDEEKLKKVLDQIYEKKISHLYRTDDVIKLLNIITIDNKEDELINLLQSYDSRSFERIWKEKSNNENILNDIPFEELKVLLKCSSLCDFVFDLKKQDIKYDFSKLKKIKDLKFIEQNLKEVLKEDKQTFFEVLEEELSSNGHYSHKVKLEDAISLIFDYLKKTKQEESSNKEVYKKIVEISNLEKFKGLKNNDVASLIKKYADYIKKEEKSMFNFSSKKTLSADSFFSVILFLSKKVKNNDYDRFGSDTYNSPNVSTLIEAAEWLQKVDANILKHFMDAGEYFGKNKEYFFHDKITFDDFKRLVNGKISLDEILTREKEGRSSRFIDTSKVENKFSKLEKDLENFLNNCQTSNKISQDKKKLLVELDKKFFTECNDKDNTPDQKLAILKKKFCTSVRVLSHHSGFFSSRKFSKFANSYTFTKDKIKELSKAFDISEKDLDTILKNKPSQENDKLFISYQNLSRSLNKAPST